MSRVDDDYRVEQMLDQKRLAAEKSAKEKEAAAQKFKSAISAQRAAKQKSESLSKENHQKQQGEKNAQSALMARMGIANRSQAERLMNKSRNDELTNDRDAQKTDKEQLSRESDTRESERAESREQSLLETPVRRKDEDASQQGQHGQQGQGQSQTQGQGGGQSGGGSGQQGQGKQDDERDDRSIGAVGRRTDADLAASATGEKKIIIGRSAQVEAQERVSTQVLQTVVEKVWSHAQQGLSEFQIQLKDDVLGGGALRVSLKDGKLKLAFSMKEPQAKNLLESSKGLLMRVFERKGLALESLEVNIRAG